MATWIDQVKAALIPRIAAQVGLTAGRGKSYGPCPACGAGTRGNGDDRGPVGLTPDSRGWACHVAGCGAEGDLVDLLAYQLTGHRLRGLTADQTSEVRKAAAQYGLWVDSNPHGLGDPLSLIRRSPSNTGNAPMAVAPEDPELVTSPSRSAFAWRHTLLPAAHSFLFSADPDAQPILQYLRDIRQISEPILKAFGIGGMVLKSHGKVLEQYVVIPLNDASGVPVNAKFRSVPGPCLHCSPDARAAGPGCKKCEKSKAPGTVPKIYRCCAGQPLPLFGADKLVPGAVIVLEGELDVVAAYEYGWDENVVSGTAGAGQEWPEEWLDRMEPHPHFVLALDQDAAGDAGAKKLAEKLGRYRCSRAKLPKKDLSDCLAARLPVHDVRRAMDDALGMVGLEIVDPLRYAAEIEALIANPDKMRGVQCSLAAINDALGGLTPGLHVISGESGHGKSTIATFLLWDFATLGHGVLLTSFEQQPVGTVQKLLRTEMQGDYSLRTPAERFQALSDLSAKGIKIVNKYGDTTDQEILDTIRYARRRRGIRIVLIDHLDYVVRVRRAGEDEREAKERVCRELAVIGVQDDICVILIVHPNNQASNQQRGVKMGDLKGASAIRQEASSVTIVDKGATSDTRPFPSAVLTFEKVRSDFGMSGAVRTIAYDPVSCFYANDWLSTPAGRGGGRTILIP